MTSISRLNDGHPGRLTRTVPRCLLAVWLTVTVLGCGGAPSTGDDAQLPNAPISYSAHIAPIIYENCLPCHRPGQSAPFDLLTYGNVRQRANQIADVVTDRYMPPWLPEPGFGHFRDQRRLTDDQIQLITRWVDEGAMEGEPADLPVMPRYPEGWQFGTPDLIATMSEVYTLPADGKDVYRNFVIPVELDASRYVRAVELQPGNAPIVHHARIMIDSTDAARRADAADDEPGWDGMLLDQAQCPDGQFIGWTPGKASPSGAEGLSWRLEPGTDLVLQMHLLPSGKPEPLRSSIGLYFAERPPARIPSLINMGVFAMDIPAGAPDYRIEARFSLPVDVSVVGVYPHAHYLGRVLDGYAILPNGTTQWLLKINNWDFNWQDEYWYAEPVPLPKGTTIVMAYQYDNSAENPANPYSPPRRVTWGPRSEDEMGDLLLQVVTRTEGDRAILQRDIFLADQRRNAGHYRFEIGRTPDDEKKHYDLGRSYYYLQRYDDAIASFGRAIELAPDYVKAHTNLGATLHVVGRLDEAMSHYRRALEIAPEHATAHSNLGFLLLDLGRRDDAEHHLREALKLDPDLVTPRRGLDRIRRERRSADPTQ